MNFNEIERLARIDPSPENLMRLGAAYLREQPQDVIQIFILLRAWWDSYGHGYSSLQIFVDNEQVGYLPPEYGRGGNARYRGVAWINENVDSVPHIDPKASRYELEKMGINIEVAEARVGRKRDM